MRNDTIGRAETFVSMRRQTASMHQRALNRSDDIEDFDTVGADGAGEDAWLGRIDQYELVRELGGGGFGTVYLARDTASGVDVAVKGLPPEVKNNREELENIRKNFALVSRLTHPNIVKALVLHPAKDVNYGLEDVRQKLRVLTGEKLLVMDYAPGVTLSKWRRQFPGGKVPREKAVLVLRQVAAALDYAHERRVIHRDVKPANIMLETQKGGRMTARVLDFGLAAEIRSSMGRVSQSLKSTAGTRPYMAPEQWEGEEQGPATDQYALAAMANELLTGKVPFSSVFDTGDPAVMMNVVLSRQFNPSDELPRNVRKALVKALAKKPQDRFASCTEFIDALAENDESSGSFAKTVAAILFCIAAVIFARIAINESRQNSSTRIDTDVEERVVVDDKADGRGTLVVPTQRPAGATSAPLPAENGAEFVQLRMRINICKSEAGEKLNEIEEFRQDSSGLESRLKIADAQSRTINALATPNTLEEARETLKIAEDAEKQIASALDWLRENKPARDQSTVERMLISLCLGDAKIFDAARTASTKYKTAETLRKDGEKAYAAGDFVVAAAKLSEARDAFSAAVAEAKAATIGATLDSARRYFDSWKWQECIAEADKVLAWDTANVEAQKLKSNALARMEPIAEFTITVDGRALPDGTTVKIGPNTYHTPVRWRVQDGQNYGGNDVTCISGGRRYSGKLERFTVDWRGPKLFIVALIENKGLQHGDTKTITLPGGATMELIYVAPGSFMMGSPAYESGREDDEVEHSVTLTQGYWLGKYEVTQKQWRSVMGYNPSRFKSDNRPVESVSWNDCQEFINKVNAAGNFRARLPTEAEWEYACRAGTMTALPNGKRLTIRGHFSGPELDDIAWYGGNSCVDFELSNGHDCSVWPQRQYPGARSGTHPVGRKKPNDWGFYDMIGNVAEWCKDNFGDYTANAVDPQGTASFVSHVFRGGSWRSVVRACRSAARDREVPGNCNDGLGFRLACFQADSASVAPSPENSTSMRILDLRSNRK